VKAQAAIVREDGAFGRFDEVEGSGVLAGAIAASDAQVYRSAAFKRSILPWAE